VDGLEVDAVHEAEDVGRHDTHSPAGRAARAATGPRR
jgi:hypothetical protein